MKSAGNSTKWWNILLKEKTEDESESIKCRKEMMQQRPDVTGEG